MEKEYQRICSESSRIEQQRCKESDESYLSATAPWNFHKNRYKDVLPLGSNGNVPTRVRVQPICGVEGSDYINANFIDCTPEKRFIACQAPVPHTIADFWRMVWEQESAVIVMLTSLVENDRIKAHAYWPPLEKTHRFGFFAVRLDEETYDSGVMTRKLTVTKLEDNSSRNITQLHFCEWPDHGVPKNCLGIRRLTHLSHFYRTYHLHNHGFSGPTIVHCSAGIGRAGTFIAIDMLLDANKYIDNPTYPKTVYDTVRWLRLRRKGMIQTVDQYKFIYKALEESKTGENNSNVSIKSLSINNNNKKTTPNILTSSIDGYQLMKLSKSKTPTTRCSSAISYEQKQPLYHPYAPSAISRFSSPNPQRGGSCRRNFLNWRSSSPTRSPFQKKHHRVVSSPAHDLVDGNNTPVFCDSM
eukprot:TRINITY_DN2051_c0_g1_i2.p1 TRINITY_DN2051_c0_g1~~TRINITY_DN2051_c0_g1_i2.p1  ORF type:complete len:413 (+),score=68.26 TRINITY_DN2051_c0_g1_i2:243-1481(+)